MINMGITQDIQRGKLHSAYAAGLAFDKAKLALESEGYRVVSLEEQAGLRVQEGIGSIVSQRGNWVREAFIFVPNKGFFLTKSSPIMANAREATKCNRNHKEFYLNEEQIEKALADSVKAVHARIPTWRFSEEEIISFAFGENAEPYGKFLKDNGIDGVKFYLPDAQDKSFARPAWFYAANRDQKSTIFGERYLNYYQDSVLGVRESANPGDVSVARKTGARVETYTSEDIQRALRELGFSGLEKQLFKKLHK